MASRAHTTHHWRAQLRLTFARDPRYDSPYDPPTVTRTYCAWVSADDETEARALLATEVGGYDELVGSEVTELVEVTSGEPEVIAVWEDR